MKHNDPHRKQYDCHIIMEYVKGMDMEAYIASQIKPPPIDIVKKFGIQIIRGLKYLHDHKIIH